MRTIFYFKQEVCRDAGEKPAKKIKAELRAVILPVAASTEPALSTMEEGQKVTLVELSSEYKLSYLKIKSRMAELRVQLRETQDPDDIHRLNIVFMSCEP